MRLPENVVENNLSEMPPPDNYAGLIYRWTDLINYEIYVSSGKEQEVPIYYLGSHGSDKELTAFVGDGYWHSSKNKDFEKVFSDPNSRLRYEILEYFDLKHDMNQKEHTMLDKVDAKNNPLYYNMNNGIVTSKEPRLSLCQEFLSDVNLQTKGYETTGKYPVVKEKIEDLEYLMAEGHPRIQVRVTDNSHTQSYIKTRIDDAGGDTSKCKPLLVYKDRGGEGVHVLGNGNTTLGAGIDTKHGTDLPVVYISKEVHGKFSDAELEVIGNLCNKVPDIIEQPTDVDAGVKYIVRRFHEGIPVESQNNKNILDAYGHNSKTIKKILKKAKEELDAKDLQLAGLNLINYESGPGKKKLERKLEQSRNETTVSMKFTSGYFKWDVLKDSLKEKQDELNESKSSTKAVAKVFIYNKTSDGYSKAKESKKKWDKEFKPYWTECIEYWIEPLGFEVIIEELPLTEAV